jgi:hypothetical protein
LGYSAKSGDKQWSWNISNGDLRSGQRRGRETLAEQSLDYQVFPRLCAFAETGLASGAGKDFHDFRQRLKEFETRLDELGVEYSRPRQAEPSFYKRIFGIFSIAQPQNKTAA